MQATIPAQRLDYYDACHKQQQEFCAAQKQKHNRPPLQRVVRNKRNQPVGLTIAFLDDGGNLMIGWSRVNRGYRNVETRRGEQVRTRRVAVGDEWNYAVGFRRAIDHARPAATMPEWIEARDDHGRRIVPDSIADAVKLMSAKASEVYKVLNIKVCRAQAVIKGSDTIIEPTKQPVALTDAINAIYEEAANAAQAIAPTAENREATKQNKQVARARRRRMYLTADGKTWIPVRLSLPPINKIAEITARRAAKRSAP